LGSSRGGGVSRLARREGLGKDIADLIRPSAIVLDDLIGDMAHGVETFPHCNFASSQASVS
jgi:hypothetical protein